MCLTLEGRLFHSAAAVIWNDLSPRVTHGQLQLPNFIPSGGLTLPDFAGLFCQLRFHDDGERHEGCASYMLALVLC